ncbi:MAG TPA: hypothetical protein DEP47_05565 [Chloroflexi bacterium]|nr:hypothetical protein [Chloroflexota bacterium]
MIVNGDDGTIAVFSMLRSQNVIAPSEYDTDGDFIDISVDLTTIYTVIKRNINGSDVYYVETFDDELLTDCAVTGGAAASGSASHLIGEEVNLLLDGAVQDNETVPGGGTVTFPRSSASSYEIGLPFTVQAVTMPVDLKLNTGTRIGFKKRIVEVNALLYETQHLKINNILIPIRTLDTVNILDNPVPEFTGTKTLYGILGYSQEAKITVSQDIPAKLTLLGLEYKVATHQGT